MMEGVGPDQLGIASAFSELVDKGDVLDHIHFVMDDDLPAEKQPAETKPAKAKSNVVKFPKKKAAKSNPKKSVLEKAEGIVRQAWDLPARQRAKAAGQAIKLSPDCSDAYVLLAECMSEPETRIGLFRQAVEAAERALETGWQNKYEGHCWQFLEARPVLRAMAMLATELQLNDELDEALALYRQLMKLTPNDNQGVRYQLASCLYEAHCDAALEKLFKDNSDDPSAALLYTKALHLFRKEGASKRANTALLKAFDANPFVPVFMSEIVEMPDNSSGRIGFGDETEAAAYIDDFCYLWGDTPGAEVWMAEQLEPGMRKSFPDKEMIDAVLIELKLE
jgi:tetratricopeptide (TPR) repeat protein